MNQRETIRRAASLSEKIGRQIEHAQGLLEALDKLTFAGQKVDDRIIFDLVANHKAAGAIIDALFSVLSDSLTDADQLEELAARLSLPTREEEPGAAEQLGRTQEEGGRGD